jgi:type II secretory pathway predicted ATPase ExeA
LAASPTARTPTDLIDSYEEFRYAVALRGHPVVPVMQIAIPQQPFHSAGKPLVFVNYGSQQAALDFLGVVLQDPRGVGLLYGPASSGKKTVIRQFLQRLPARLAVAEIDGNQLSPLNFLHAALEAFESNFESDSYEELLKFLVTLLLQQARNVGAPLILIGNLNRMLPATLSLLCKLAAIRLRGKYALRLIMHSRTPPYAIVHAPAMHAVATRLISAFELGPLTRNETANYLHEKLRAAGCNIPGLVISRETCDQLYEGSNGWPGILDGLAMRVLEQRENLHGEKDVSLTPDDDEALPVLYPVSDLQHADTEDLQRLLVTLQGRTLFDFDLHESKTLIGRSRLCDVVIDSRFVSKFHALILRRDDGAHLVDLNSSNGTFVNSQRIGIKALRHDDVISLGNHGIKLLSPGLRSRAESADRDIADTATMRTLADARREKLAPGLLSVVEQQDKN